MITKYNHKKIEECVQNYWEKNNIFKVTRNIKKKKYYCLSMFPYPSGNIHVGHVRNYTIGDIISRFYRMRGKNVLYPIGWDSFGLPAENAAIRNNISPKEWTFKNIKKMKSQLKSLGFSFDWSKEISTCSSKYYKWEQLFFKILFKKKIVYKKYSYVNWCSLDRTVLSNEQVIDNKCWLCKSNVIKKNINQWFIKITNYADKLLYGLNKLNLWPEKVKVMQKNWIGKLEWIEIKLKILNFFCDKYITVYIKNIYEFINSDFLIISFENKISNEIFNHKYNCNKYIFFIKNELLETEFYVKNIFTKKKILIKISNNNFILNNIFFNEISNLNKLKSNFKIKNVNMFKNNNLYKYKNFILNNAFCIKSNINKKLNININKYIIKKFFVKKVKYNIKDWCVSRQRYWGVPIPMAKIVKNNIIVPIPDKYLPINLYKYKNNIKKITNRKIILNKNVAFKETDTLDTFVQSSWYYAKYTCVNYNKDILDKKSTDYWLPIDQYIGGIEHANMHLLYIRFFNKLMKKFGFIKYKEPVKRLLCQGMILSKTFYYLDKNNNKIWVSYKDVYLNHDKSDINYLYLNKIPVIYDGLNKMSKSKNNGINPDYLIEKYGSDTLKLFIIFSAPANCNFVWEEKNIIGIYRFLNKVWKLVINFIYNYNVNDNLEIKLYLEKEDIYFINDIILKITDDIKNKQKFNSSVALLMKLTNKLIILINKNKYNKNLIEELIFILIKLLYPFAPHISFVLWRKLGNKNNIDYESWPKIKKISGCNDIFFILKINNKFICKISIPIDSSKEYIIKYLNNNLNINIENNISKIIFVKNKLINLIINKSKTNNDN